MLPTADRPAGSQVDGRWWRPSAAGRAGAEALVERLVEGVSPIVDRVPAQPARFRDVLAVGEFRVLWIAHAQSRLGDQLARVAIAVLVYNRTSSALLTALTYALTFLPPLVSAPLLAGVADRWPRRSVLVLTDLCRAGLVALMAIPAMPLIVLVVLLVAVVSLQPLYSAARNAVLPSVVTGDRYVVGMGIINVTDSIMQVAGFAFGGMLLGLLGPSTALGIDAGTFVLSAVLVRLGARPHRPIVEDAESDRSPSGGGPLGRGLEWLRSDPRLRSLAGLIWLYGFYVAPEGIAAPYAAQIGADTAAVGLLMAADPVGAGIGAVVLSRWVRPASRPRLLGPLAVLAGIPLVLSAIRPSVPSAFVLWTASGILSSHVMFAIAELTLAVPDHRRGQVLGLVAAGLHTAQGLGVSLAGALAGWYSPSTSVAICGAAGTLCALRVGHAWDRARRAA